MLSNCASLSPHAKRYQHALWKSKFFGVAGIAVLVLPLRGLAIVTNLAMLRKLQSVEFVASRGSVLRVISHIATFERDA